MVAEGRRIARVLGVPESATVPLAGTAGQVPAFRQGETERQKDQPSS